MSVVTEPKTETEPYIPNALTEQQQAERVLSLRDVILRMFVNSIETVNVGTKIECGLTRMMMVYLLTNSVPNPDEVATYNRTVSTTEFENAMRLYQILPEWAQKQIDPVITGWRERFFGDPDEKTTGTTQLSSHTTYNKPIQAFPFMIYQEAVEVNPE